MPPPSRVTRRPIQLEVKNRKPAKKIPPPGRGVGAALDPAETTNPKQLNRKRPAYGDQTSRAFFSEGSDAQFT